MYCTDENFRLAEWSVEPSLLRLIQGGEARTVGTKVMAVLLCLAARPGELVSKDELVAEAWGGDAASDEALTAVVYELRRALGDDTRRPRFIGTIRSRGYRLLVTPEPVESSSGDSVEVDRTQEFRALESLGEEMPPASRRVEDGLVSAPPRSRRATRAEEPPASGVGAGLAARDLPPARINAAVSRRLGEESSRSSKRSGVWLARAAGLLLVAGLLWGLAWGAAPDRAQDAMSGTAATEDGIRSVAVLALEPRGEEPSEEPSLFAQGLSERLAIDLARSGWLDVVPAFSSVFAGANASRAPVDAVVEGAVRRRGDRLSVTVQLIAADGQLLWGGSWEKVAGDLATLEVELAGEIAKRLRGRLGSATQLARAPEVEDALRLGRHFLGVDSPLQAKRYFSFALERQPTLAPAHVGMAEALLAGAGEQPPEARDAVVAAARQAAQTALEIDADLPAAHASLGTIALVHEGDMDGARQHFERADFVRADHEHTAPASSLRGYATFLSAVSRHGEAIDLLRQALISSPASVQGRLDLARALYLAGQFEQALAELLVLDQLAPLQADSARLRAEILWVQGEHRLAVEACRQAVELAGGAAELAALIGELYEEVGLEAVIKCLQDLPETVGSDHFGPMHLARLEAVRGDAGAALGLIRLAEEQASPELVWLAVDPAFSSLHGLADFEQLLEGRRLSV